VQRKEKKTRESSEDTVNHSSSESVKHKDKDDTDDNDDQSFEADKNVKKNARNMDGATADQTVNMKKITKKLKRKAQRCAQKNKVDSDNLAVGVPQKVGVLPHVGVFLCYSKKKTPLTFEVFLNRTSGLPSTVIFLHLKRRHVPVVTESDRVKISVIDPNKIYYISVSFGYAEHVGTMVIPAILMNASHLGLPQIELEKITLFVPADSVQVVNKKIYWKVVLNLYTLMKNLFFGQHRIPFPTDYTVYLATVASL